MEKRENRKQWPLTILISYLVLILADVVCGISLRFSFCFFFAADADPSDARDHFLRKWRLRRWWGIIRRPGTCMLENVKFLFISAHSSNRLQTKGLEIPCFAHVSVPFGCSRMQALYANASCDIAVSHAHKRSFSLARF